MSNFGTIFRVTTFGESHCKGVGCIVEGVPPGMKLTEEDIQPQLTRRRPGQSKVATKRDEKDKVTILSGTENGMTLGTPIGLSVPNEDQRPGDYSSMNSFPRPSHADFTYLEKYGIKASSGGGRASARETIGRVAAGAIAEKYLYEAYKIEIIAWVHSVGNIAMKEDDELHKTITREIVDQNPVRCPDKDVATEMEKLIAEVLSEQDSIGGTVSCVIRNVPTGLGEPVFDKLEAKLAHAMLSIPATKGFEIGSGFEGTKLRGSKHNDPFIMKNGRLGTSSNNSGGIQGGISNGECITFRVGFKPPATISQSQQTSQYDGTPGELAAKGRHDPCVVPRAIAIVEGMAALVIMDALMIQLSRKSASLLIQHKHNGNSRDEPASKKQKKDE